MHSLLQKVYCSPIGFFWVITYSIFGQNQKKADSLVQIYKTNTVKGVARLEMLRGLAFNELNNLQLALKYSEELIRLAGLEKNHLYLYRGYQQKGNKQRLLGNLDEALESYFRSVEAAKAAQYSTGEGSVYCAIADIYSISKNHKNAMLYYNKAIATLRKTNDQIPLGAAISNAGDELLNHKNFQSALRYFKESGTIFEKANYPTGKAYSLGNMGMVYANIGKKSLAEKNINSAIKMLEELKDFYPICVYLIAMCDIYIEKGEKSTAMNYALRSLNLAQKYGLKEQISDANFKLSEIHEKLGNPKESLRYYKSFVVYRDSINNLKTVQKMADLRTDHEVSQKQIEVDLLNQERKNQQITVIALFIILALAIILLGTLYWYFGTISREKRRSESLLLNILPAETAEELKRNGKVNAIKFEQVTVLFTDFVEFSKSAEHIAPEQLVKSIDFYFKAFDEITTKYELEKIKTIGDSYMCACGLPKANPAHAANVINAAREMINLVDNVLNAQDGLSHYEIRIGIHTGPVVAGIVGIKKWQYDIWGDTVNIASRMESKSYPGRINLSETTYQLVKDLFHCEYRGEIEVKNRGLLKMYFLS